MVIPLDLQRMFLGDLPLLFLVEIVLRTVIVYAYALLVIRWIGGRGIGQMSVIEFLLVVALGSAVGDAMFYPEVPLIHALLVITVVGVINKLIDIGMCQSPRIRRFFSGRAVQVLRNGRIDMPAMRQARVNRDEVFEKLREQGIGNLGLVRHGFLETSGNFSFFRHEDPVKGLGIVPAWDVEPPAPVPHHSADAVCATCGAGSVGSPACSHCGGTVFTRAVAARSSSAG
jgi:uncharacterized membrane protein YcaP (DUF421 family)